MTIPKPTAEFEEKQAALALFLFNMNNGPCESMDQVVRDYGTDYRDNYMLDANDILQSNPHLLGLETREAMGLWDEAPDPEEDDEQ